MATKGVLQQDTLSHYSTIITVASWIIFGSLFLPEEAGYCLRRRVIFVKSNLWPLFIFLEINFCPLHWTWFRLRLVGHVQVADKGVVQCLGEGGVVVGVGREGDGRRSSKRVKEKR